MDFDDLKVWCKFYGGSNFSDVYGKGYRLMCHCDEPPPPLVGVYWIYGFWRHVMTSSALLYMILYLNLLAGPRGPA